VLTAAARGWVEEKVHIEGWQWLGASTFAVDHGYVFLLADAMTNAGLVLEFDC
jgi:hypothetical protein